MLNLKVEFNYSTLSIEKRDWGKGGGYVRVLEKRDRR
jgi:hypothetical protein